MTSNARSSFDVVLSLHALVAVVSLSVSFTTQASVADASLSSTPEMKSVIVTTDCGTEIDDQWAIIHLARSPQVHLLGVVGNFAPNAGKGADTAACARNALDVAGRKDVPSFAGADSPLVSSFQPSPNKGVQFILDTSKNFTSEHRLTLMGLGTGTDVASALLLDPTLADRIEFAALAFNAYPAGGDGWNVTNDVASYQVIMNSNVPVTLASGQIANDRLTLHREEAKALVADQGPIGTFLIGIYNKFLDDNGKYFPETDGGTHWPIWDDAVTAIVLGMTTSEKVPRPNINLDQTFSFPNTQSHAAFNWVVTLDRDKLFSNLRSIISTKTEEN